MNNDDTAIYDCLLFINGTLAKARALRAYIDNTCGRTGVHAECKRRLREAIGDVDNACRALTEAKEVLK